MFNFLKKDAEKKASGENDLTPEDLEVLEKATALELKGHALSFEDEDLAVPEIHVNRFSKDMEYVEELLEEEEKENEPAIETENLAFPEIHFSKLKKRT